MILAATQMRLRTRVLFGIRTVDDTDQRLFLNSLDETVLTIQLRNCMVRNVTVWPELFRLTI